MKRLLVIAVAAVLLVPAQAQAGWKIERALETASVVWGGQLERVCPQGVSVTVSDAGAMVSAEGVRLSDATAWAKTGECSVRINRTRWSDLRAYEPYCSVIMHETGHIIGLGHTAKGIMRRDATFALSSGRVGHRRVEEWAGTDRRCRKRGRPYLSRHGRL